MNKILSCLLSVIIFTSIVFGQKKEWEPRFEVATWADFAQCAITHSFDDNIHLAGKELEIFDEREFNVTLFTVTTAAYWPNCIEAFDKGHEISSHGTSIDTNNTEFAKSYKDIITHVPGAKGLTLAYPSFKMPDYRFGLDNYIAARVWDERLNDKTPSDWYQVSSKMFNYSVEKRDYSINSGVHALDSFADEAAIKNGWAVYCHQGIGDYADDWAYIAIDTLEKHLDYLYNNKDKFWVENFGNVVRYIKERDAVSIKQTDSTNYGFTIFVNDTLDNEIYNYPLTIRMLIPGMNWAGTFDIPTPIADGKKYIDVSQNGVRSDNYIVTEGEMQYVVFNVIPDGGEIKVMNLKTYENTKQVFLDKTAAPFCTVKNRMLQINREHFGNSSLSVGIFDINGRMLAKHNLKSKESSVTLDAGKISRSAFIVKISDGVTSHTQRFLPQF